jgi:shikimate kinase
VIGDQLAGDELAGDELAGDQGSAQRPVAILIGPPGAGKSTVGALLAARIGVAFLDTDDSVQAVAGKPVSDIFIEDGEPAFRELERAAVAAAIGTHGGVLGLGGGAVLDEATQTQLAGQTVVYLETGFSELAKRVGLDRPRPLLLGNPRAQLKALLEQRLPVYARLAQITVLTDGRDPAEIAGQIAAHVSGPGGPAAAPAVPAGPEGGPGPAGTGRSGP